jgi:hypothetical protein
MPCPVVFLDIKKAFDRVWHPMLLSCLYDASITGRAWRWICAFLSRRRIRTIQLTTCSNWHTIAYGVPQGCVLSPLLFLIFINPILDRITRNCLHVCPLAFADDGVLAPAVVERDPAVIAMTCQRRGLPPSSIVEHIFRLPLYIADLHLALSYLDAWCDESRVRFGSDKTKVVVFCGAQDIEDMTPYLNFRLCGFTIGLTDHYTYLGLVLQRNLSWTKHFEDALATARAISSLITRITMSAPTPHYQSVRSLVLGLLLPSFAYGIAFWGRDLPDASLRQLNSALIQPLRRCLCLPRTTHQLGVLVETHCPSVRAWMTRDLLLLFQRFASLPANHPSHQLHALDLTPRLPPSHAAHHLLVDAKYISTSRYVQLILLPTLGRDLQPFIHQRCPVSLPARLILQPPPSLRADQSDPFAYLACLAATGTGRRAQLITHLNPPGHLQDIEQWVATVLPNLTPIAIRQLAMWITHYEWRHPADPIHRTDAPLLLCKPYPRPSHYLALEGISLIQVRSRLRNRRSHTGEHHRQLEDKTASAACTHAVCQSQQPNPPDETVEHILLQCPHHAAIRASLLAAFRAATHSTAQLTLPFILGEAVDTHTLTKATTPHYCHLLHLSATFLQNADQERQAAHHVAFKPP